MVVVVVAIQFRLKCVVHQIQRIDRLEQLIVISPWQLPDIGLRRIEQNPLLEVWEPLHLHFYDELATASLLATHIDNRVLAKRGFRNKLRRQILYRLDLLAVIKRQQGVKEAYDEIFMLAKNLLEGHVRLWIKVFCHVFCLAFRSRA